MSAVARKHAPKQNLRKIERKIIDARKRFTKLRKPVAPKDYRFNPENTLKGANANIARLECKVDRMQALLDQVVTILDEISKQ